MDLDTLFQCGNTNPKCGDCSILSKSKREHCILDEEIEETEILFVSDSLKFYQGQYVAFSIPEYIKIKESLVNLGIGGRVAFTASLRCPDVKNYDLIPADKDFCRNHLSDAIEAYKPKLVFACGNLAMNMLTKKSGLHKKRGLTLDYISQNGFEVKVMPIFHPYEVLTEPKHELVWEIDILNAYRRYILEVPGPPGVPYTLLDSKPKLRDFIDNIIPQIEAQDLLVDVDLESTGLDFTSDTIHTISYSYRELTGEISTKIMIIDHPESPLGKEERELSLLGLKLLMENEKIRKSVQNAKFEIRFFLSYGIRSVNVADNQIFSSCVNENTSTSLMNMMKVYFGDHLEDL